MDQLQDHFSLFPLAVFRSIVERYVHLVPPEIPLDDDDDAMEYMAGNTWVTGIEEVVRILPLTVKRAIEASVIVNYPPDRDPKNVNVLNTALCALFDKHGFDQILPDLVQQMRLALVRLLFFFPASFSFSLSLSLSLPSSTNPLAVESGR
jgi:hypothetical protein